ncbi:MAG: fasciclin domain-containing protein [Bacteroidaceae bacterium]|nr:fasciclin domain-containing protein [Bacteroidaceae bacterium]
MNNNIKNTLRWGLLAVAGASVMLSCTDTWDDHYDSASSNGYAGTTMKAIEEKASEFADIIKAVGYQRELASENIYTVWAPANGTFDKDAWLELAQTDKQQVIDRFIKNHMTRYAVSQNTNDQVITLLNKKLVTMTDAGKNLFGGQTIQEANLGCTNGVLHIIENENEYVPNINELIKDQYVASTQPNKKKSSLYAFIEEKDSDILDESRSVSRGVDENGNKIWVDSVTIHTNLVLDAISAEIYEEDSNFIAIIPSDAAWQKRYKLAASLLKFNPSEDNLRAGIVDSLKHLYAGHFLLRDLFFNNNVNLHKEDSLVSTNYVSSRGSDWPNGVYYTKAPARGLPLDKEVNDILAKAGDPIACSNGVGYLVEDFPMSPTEQFFLKRTIRARPYLIDQATEKPLFTSGTGAITEKSATFDVPVYDEYGEKTDVITRSYHFTDVTTKNSSTQIDVGFKLYSTLSGTYDLYLVTCPIWAKNGYTNPDGELIHPSDPDADNRGYKFSVSIYERIGESKDGKNLGQWGTGKSDYTDLIVPGTEKDKNFVIEPYDPEHPEDYRYKNYVDTLYLGKFTFKNAYYGRSDEGVIIKLSSKAKSGEVKNTYSREMLISDFILKPDLEATEAAIADEDEEEEAGGEE